MVFEQECLANRISGSSCRGVPT